MSKAELVLDQQNTYEAICRLIDSERTTGQVFKKLVERLEWVNREMVQAGFMPSDQDGGCDR